MFTLKLYRRKGPDSVQKTTMVMTVDHVVAHEIGEKKKALELHAFNGPQPSGYNIFYVGEPEEGMDAFGKPLHLDIGDQSWWGWGLLENAAGNTTEHYRPGSYGL